MNFYLRSCQYSAVCCSPVETDLVTDQLVEPVNTFQLLLCLLLLNTQFVSFAPVTLYFVFSVSTLILYWAWFIYLKYAMGENEASKEVNMW